jgi:glycosyltransferase involved in cell wall biosynthesis
MIDPAAPYLSVIIPAYNEERRIAATLASVAAYLGKQAFSWELLIVLDGCSDRTAAQVAPFTAAHPQIRIIDRTQNQRDNPAFYRRGQFHRYFPFRSNEKAVRRRLPCCHCLAQPP